MEVSTKFRSYLLWAVFVSSLFSFRGIKEPVKINNVLPACTSAPSIMSPTTASIGTTTATLGGNVTSAGTGGCSITDGGVNYSITAGQPTALTGTNASAGVTTTGVFTKAISGLTAATKYYFVAYATNGFGTAVTVETSFYTLSTAPLAQPVGTFTAAPANPIQIDLSFSVPANNGAVGAAGYAVFRKQAATLPSLNPLNAVNGQAPATDGTITFVGTTSASATTFADLTASAGTQYTYALIPFGYDGTNSGTYNYLTSGTFLTATAYSYATLPLAQPTFTASTVSDVQINLSFSVPPNDGTIGAAGYLIYRKAGSTISGISFPNGAAAPASNAGATLITTTTAAAPSFSDLTVTAGNQYSYAIIPFGYDGSHAVTYNFLTASYPTATGFTLSTVPNNQPASVTANAVSPTQINLTFTPLPNPPPSAGNVMGYVILRRPGTDPATSSVQNGTAPASLVLGSSTLVTTITTAGIASFNDTGLSSGTQYNYAVVPFNWDGTNAPTYNYKTGGGFTTNHATTYLATSTITLNGGTTNSIGYINFPTVGAPLDNSSGNCESLADFKITDPGGDGQPTTLNSVTISVGNSSMISEIAIFDNSGTNVGQVTNPGSSVVFSSLSISAANNNTADFQIWATFKNTVTDQSIVQLTITAATVASSGSGLSSFAATTGGSTNKIVVTALQLGFFYSGSQVSSLPGALPGANFASPTSVVVSAVDNNGNIQIGKSSTVTLTMTSGSGTLASTQTLVKNLVGGTISWSNLTISQGGGSKTIHAAYGNASLAAGNVTININSTGVSITQGTVPQMCYSGDYQTITDITIAESDATDFAVGSGVTFSMILPTGFLFNNAVTTAPTVAGIPGPATDLSAMSALSYSVDKTTVTFSYTVGGTANTDKIIIHGLQVNYTGTTPVASANLIRLGGTAVQQGNATSDAKVFCVLSSANSATVVSFTVQTIPGQPSVNPTDTRFQVGINSVQLVGNPSGGVFSGPGVSPNATYGYVFSPSSVGVSTGNAIVYTYQETTGQHCHVSAKQNFDVYASVIQNLNIQYCTNATPSTGLSVLQADINSQFSPAAAGSYTFYDIVYLNSFASSTSYTVGPLYGITPTTNTNYIYTYTYNLLGTQTTAETVVNTYTYNNYYGFMGYTSVPTFNSGPGSVSTFDPSQPYYKNYYTYGVYIYYRASNGIVAMGGGQFVSLVAPPTVTFSIAKLAFCDYDAPVVLTGSPTPVTPATDNFSGAAGIGTAITSPSTNNWLFSPGNIGTKSTPINVTYHYTDPSSNCSNTASKPIQVNPQPGAVPLSNIKVNGVQTTNLYSCQNTALSPTTGKFDATPIAVPATTYKWYYDAGLTTPSGGLAGNSFVPPVDVTTVGATNYYVTQSVLGCESTGLTVTANITTPVSIVTATPSAICSASQFDLSTIGTIGGLISGGTTTGTWSGAGNFFDAGQNPTTASGTTKFYTPTATEQTNGSAVITLTSNTPAAPNACPFVSQGYTIPISTAISINPINPITVCPGQSSAPIIISTIINGAGVTSATWSSTLAQGEFQEVVAGVPSGPQNRPLTISATAGTPVQVAYFPTANEINSASNIVLSDVNVASNSTGTCGAANATMVLTLNAAPKVSIGVDQTICADQPVNLSGTFGGSATSATWTTSGTGNLVASSSSSSPVTATYTLDPALELPNPSVQFLTFTLTTNDPDGTGPTGPCVAAVSQEPLTLLPLTVTVNPIPQSPVINLPTYPNLQPAYCVNDPLVNNLSAAAATGNTINWYRNANATGFLNSGTLNTGAYVVNSNAGITSFYATQVTPAGCESKGQIPNSSPAQFNLVINPNPSLNFKAYGTSASLTGLCAGDQTILDASTSTIAQSPSAGSIASYQWDFLDTSPISVSPSPTVTHQFALGNYNVQLTATSDKGCKSVINASSIPSISPKLPNNSLLIIGPYPVANFTIVGQCLGSPTQFTSLNLSNPLANIPPGGYAWDFGDGNLSTLQNPTNSFPSVNTYTTTLTLTSDRGCVHSIPKPVYILPTINFTAANNYFYNESFENNNNAPLNGGWAKESFIVNSSGSSTPSWNLQSPAGTVIRAASNGSNAWVAGLIGSNNNTYYINEKSALNSPCFDMGSAGLTKPIIDFDYLSDTWLKNDGTYLEFSYDNGQNWNVLGSINKGLNWYQDNFILGLQTTILPIGNPVGQSLNQQGWDGNSRTWQTGAFSLSTLIPSGNPTQILRLRFVFGSNKTADPTTGKHYDGFGLDNVFIQNSNRTVLAENFTNETANAAAPVNHDLNFANFESSASQQALVKIEYHTSFGGADPDNALNPADPQARAAFYGIVGPFKGFIDGKDGTNSLVQSNNFNGNIKPGVGSNQSNAENYFDTRALVPSPMLINLSVSASGTIVTITATINTLSGSLPPGTASSNRYLIQLGIVENVGGQSILRKLLPNASGTPLTALSANSNQTITYTWESSAPINPANLSAVCFVQDQTNQDVLQAAAIGLPNAGVTTAVEALTIEGINAYPNPADQEFTIQLVSPAQQSLKLTMANQLGQFTEVGSINEGEQSKKISTQGLADGIYILQLGSNGNALRTKVVVLHK